MNYSEKLKDLREYSNINKRITQQEVADYLNVSQRAYARYELQDDIIPVKHLDKICNFFNISIDCLFNFSNIENYPNSNKEIDKIKAGNRLKEFRKENNLTQEKVAKLLKIDQPTWSIYEKGKSLIGTPFLYAICKKYNISADYLLGRTDSPKYLK